jgi:hypothetical protein
MSEPRPNARVERNRETHNHQRWPDEAESAGVPLENKESDDVGPREGEPGAGPGAPTEDPHHQLNRPVGEPDPTADSDPYE